MYYSSLVEKAARMAIEAHATQTRKSDNFPYVIHPILVGHILAKAGGSDEVIAAGFVHDVVEDTACTLEDVRARLGETVAGIVATVSENKALPWEDRKRAYIDAVRAGSTDARLVSLADKVHNARSVLDAHEREGESVWRYFKGGKETHVWFMESMLTMFRETLEHPLVDEYAALVEELRRTS